jgi:uncharacterized membrane protein YfcA
MSPVLILAILVGLAGQIVDGTLGMAYGVTCSTFLLALGIAPAMISYSVKVSEIFTTGASGISHIFHENVNRTLCLELAIPGVVGGVTGAYLLSNFDGAKFKPWISAYLILMGGYIFWRSNHKPIAVDTKATHAIPLALTGGFLDAVGGGGWGPVVASTLLAKGHPPRYVIGSVNMAEFFVTLTQALTFFFFLKLENLPIIAGLILGGMIAAPFAAKLCKILPAKTMMRLVGVLLILVSTHTLLLALKII